MNVSLPHNWFFCQVYLFEKRTRLVSEQNLCCMCLCRARLTVCNAAFYISLHKDTNAILIKSYLVVMKLVIVTSVSCPHPVICCWPGSGKNSINCLKKLAHIFIAVSTRQGLMQGWKKTSGVVTKDYTLLTKEKVHFFDCSSCWYIVNTYPFGIKGWPAVWERRQLTKIEHEQQ